MPWKKHRNEVLNVLKKLCLALLALCLTLCAACGEKPASQQAETLPPKQSEEEIDFTLAGDGTEENPYQIAALEDLIQFAAVMNANNAYADYANCYFLLTADIDLNDVSAYDEWGETPPANVWTPIGCYHSFNGVFDGNGHTIRGLYIDQAVCEDEYGRVLDKFGLFGSVYGEIKDLTIQNAYVAPQRADIPGASPCVGILAGSGGGVIRGCTVEGRVICDAYECGGIIGSITEDEAYSVNIENCSFENTDREYGIQSLPRAD